MRSFRARLILATATISLLAIVLTAWAIAARTQEAIVERLEEQENAEAEILELINGLAFEVGEWVDATELIAETADEYGARIVLTDIAGRPLVDSGSGELPVVLTGLIDPVGPFSDFEMGISEDQLNLAVSDCLTIAGVDHEIDEFGVVPLEDVGDSVMEACWDEAFEAVGAFDDPIADQAYLFVDYNVDPPIPWAQLGLVATVVLALAVVATTVTSGVIAGPVRRLTAATRSIRSGDLSARVEGGGSDELADLSDSFNEMASSLQGADTRRKQLASDIAHELRSPVTNIIGHLDAVEDGVLAPSQEHLGVVSAEAMRLHSLIEDLAQLAAADEGVIRLDREQQDVGVVVTRAIEARRMVADDRSITLQCNCRPAAAFVDGGRIEQVVGNLLDNAFAAVSDGGLVLAEVSIADGTVSVTVSDDGVGIPEELLDSLFDRLRRADKARTPGDAGRGLGLAISRALIRAHGGDIRAENRQNGGARFTMTLPT